MLIRCNEADQTVEIVPEDEDQIDWKLKLMQVLECFGQAERTWFENYCEDYGISKSEMSKIKKTFEDHYNNKNHCWKY